MVNGGVGFEREYRGFNDCVQKMLQKEGVRGFYSGMLANLVKVVPALALQFTVFDGARSLIFE